MKNAQPTKAQVEEHIVYEIEAMSRSAVRYCETVEGPMQGATPMGFHDAVFFLEAALGHARTLITTFGFPDKAERRLVETLGVVKGFVEHFRRESEAGGLSSGQLYGQLSELVGHVGPIRWNTPASVEAHRPIAVATAVLNGLAATGLPDLSLPVGAAMTDARQRLATARPPA